MPVLGASTVAIRLVLSGLKSGRARANRTDHARGAQPGAHARQGGLRRHGAPLGGGGIVGSAAARSGVDRPSCWRGARIRYCPAWCRSPTPRAHLVGSVTRCRWKEPPRNWKWRDGSEAIRHALAYERRVTIVRPADARELIDARVGASGRRRLSALRGAVVASVPLDAEFADRLKAQLAADVVIYVDDAPTASSFVAADGKREVGFAAPTEMAQSGARRAEPHHRGARVRPHVLGGLRADSRSGRAPAGNVGGGRRRRRAGGGQESGVALAGVRRPVGGGVRAGAGDAPCRSGSTRPLGHLHAERHRRRARRSRSSDRARDRRRNGRPGGGVRADDRRGERESRALGGAHARDPRRCTRSAARCRRYSGLDRCCAKWSGEVAAVLAAKRCALLLTHQADGTLIVGRGAVGSGGGPNTVCPSCVRRRPGAADQLRIERVEGRDRSTKSGQGGERDRLVDGRTVGAKRSRAGNVVGQSSGRKVKRASSCRRSPDADLRLLATFADHASNAISNARLYDEVQKASEELEIKVKERTFDLVVANRELEQALDDLRAAQAALVHSEGAWPASGNWWRAWRTRSTRRRRRFRAPSTIWPISVAAGAALARARRLAHEAGRSHALLRARRAAGAAVGAGQDRSAVVGAAAGARAGRQQSAHGVSGAEAILSNAGRDWRRRNRLSAGAAGPLRPNLKHKRTHNHKRQPNANANADPGSDITDIGAR